MPSSVVPAGGRRRRRPRAACAHSTVTDLARLRGWSTSVPRATAVWYANSWSGMIARTGLSISVRSRHPEDVVRDVAHALVALGRHGDDARVAGAALHEVADELVVHGAARGHGDERHLRVEQRDGSVLQLAGGVALGVDVADLLELEGALERDRVRDAASHEHVAARADVAAGQPLGRLLVQLERPLGGRRQVAQARRRARAPGPGSSRPRSWPPGPPRAAASSPGSRTSWSRRRRSRGRPGGRARASASRVIAEPTVFVTAMTGQPRCARQARRGERVGGLARLRDRDDERALVERRRVVAELGADVPARRQPGPGLQRVAADRGRVGGAAAGDELDAFDVGEARSPARRAPGRAPPRRGADR